MTSDALTTAARHELALRQRDWPAKVAAGEMERDWASADIRRWQAIATLVEHGRVDFTLDDGAEPPLTFADLLAAVDFAEARVGDRIVATPEQNRQRALEQRFGLIVAIRRRLERAAWRIGQHLDRPFRHPPMNKDAA